MKLKAYTKINLTLEVLGKRPDGYHEIVSVLQTISMADILSIEPAGDLIFRCDVAELETEDNLVPKAARLLREATGCKKGALIELRKKTPLASGLGAGSSDAATCLIGLNKLWGLGVPLPKLLELASKLGSDVPFFLYRGTALAEGRGERITPLPPAKEFRVVLLEPPVGTIEGKTAKMYSLLKPSYYTKGQHTQELIKHIEGGGAVDNSVVFNVFEKVAFGFFSGLEECRSRFEAAGADMVHLAGAGPSLFTIVPGKAAADGIVNKLKEQGLTAHSVSSVPGWTKGTSCGIIYEVSFDGEE